MCNVQSDLEKKSAQKSSEKPNCVFILGPTASGKTSLAVQIALWLDGEIISADSRQVYTGLDIGSGKDLKEYSTIFNGEKKIIPYHLIDIVPLSCEYSVFNFQKDFYASFNEILKRKKIPICAGGTGMFLDSVLREYDFVPCPKNFELREWAKSKTDEELRKTLIFEKKKMHNTTELTDRQTIIKALEIHRFKQSPNYEKIKNEMPKAPKIFPLIIGVTFERNELRKKIEARLDDRIKNGMIEEVENLHKNGISWERLERLGLEYRFVSKFLQGKFSQNQMREKLNIAIRQFAKRQETWFRFMEKNGVKINWLSKNACNTKKTEEARILLQKIGLL